MTNSQDVTGYLQRTVQEGEAPSDQKLTFDPTTGQLVVKKPSDTSASQDVSIPTGTLTFFRG